MDRFAAPRDRALTVATWAFGLLLPALAIALPMLLLPDPGEGTAWMNVLITAAVLLVLPVTWALSPRGFTVGPEDVTVERLLRPVRLPLTGIRAVALLPPEATRRSLRVAGASGLFGHFGYFRSPALGAYRLYATRSARLVGLDTDAGRFVLSPEPPEAFVEAVRRRAPRAAATLASAPVGSRWRTGWWLAGGAMLLVVLAIGLTLLGVLAFAPCGVAVSGDVVRIERRWVGPVELPLASLRSVARLSPEAQRGWRRTAGAALGTVGYGRYASTRLGSFQLYAWRRGPAVLRTPEGRVVLTPDDPDAFVAEVGARLGR